MEKQVFSDPRKLRQAYPDQFVVGVVRGSSQEAGINKIEVISHGIDAKKVGIQAEGLIKEQYANEQVIAMTTSLRKGQSSGIVFDARILTSGPHSSS